jgi:epoxide hydrolase-like predicted phosphatase
MTDNHSIQAVIWDMGGVLVRTEDYQPRQQLAEQYGLTRLELEDLVFGTASADLASLGKISYREHFQQIGRTLNINGKMLEEFEHKFWAGDRMDWELISFIKNLRPKYKTGLLSNAWSDSKKIVESAFAFSFEQVFDTTVFSADVGLMKPDEAIYALVLSQLNCAAETAVFIDDMPENIEAAREAGLKGIRFQSHSQVVENLKELLA